MKKLKQWIKSKLRKWLFPELSSPNFFNSHVVQIPTETVVLRASSQITRQQIADLMTSCGWGEDEILRKFTNETIKSLISEIEKKEMIEIRIIENHIGYDNRFNIEAMIRLVKPKL